MHGRNDLRHLGHLHDSSPPFVVGPQRRSLGRAAYGREILNVVDFLSDEEIPSKGPSARGRGPMCPTSWLRPGHTDPKMTLGLYAQVIASKTDHGAALDGIVGASDWAATGSESPSRAVAAVS